jgi:hypothetical protein
MGGAILLIPGTFSRRAQSQIYRTIPEPGGAHQIHLFQNINQTLIFANIFSYARLDIRADAFIEGLSDYQLIINKSVALRSFRFVQFPTLFPPRRQ